MATQGKTKLSFEQALTQLEQIVSAMESGEIGLEASIAKYAEGAKLIAHCRKVLDSAEKKIQLLTAGSGQTLEPSGELDEPDSE